LRWAFLERALARVGASAAFPHHDTRALPLRQARRAPGAQFDVAAREDLKPCDSSHLAPLTAHIAVTTGLLHAPQHDFGFWLLPISDRILTLTARRPMPANLTLSLNVLALCMAFAVITAILIGAF